MNTQYSKSIRPKAIDLFCGAGGMSLGFEQAGFDVISAVEIDPIHAAVHKYNFPMCKTFCMDVKRLSGTDLCLGMNEVDVLFGGPPCQGFSLIGKRNIEDPRNSLVSEFIRLVKEIKPRYFVMENVAGLTIGDAKKLLDSSIRFVESIGYNIVPYKVINAVDYGVPQSRKRVFLLGYRNDQKPIRYPGIITKKTLVRDAISDLPDIDSFDELIDDDKVEYNVKPQSNYAQMLHSPELDCNDFSYPRIWNKKMLTGSMRTIHTDASKERFSLTSQGEVEPISRFLRLSMDGVCNTLRAGTDKSRGAYTSPRPIHPLYSRCISVREAQRLHSFPDWFRMHSTKWHGFREVGNSVPPLLARAVASQIMKALDSIATKPDISISLGNEESLYFNSSEAMTFISKE